MFHFVILKSHEKFVQKWKFIFNSAKRKKKLIAFEGPLRQLETNWPISGELIGKAGFNLAQTFHGLSVSQNKTPMKSFASGSLPFPQKKPIKFEIWTYLPAQNKFTNFWWADLESSIQFWPKHSTALQYHKIKVLWKASLQTTYLSDKTNQ